MERQDKILDFLNSLPVDIDFGYIDCDNIVDFDSLRDEIENNDLLNVDIIYYSNAMNYLSENDASLQVSLEIAGQMGCSLENLNSETLASLLATENLRTEFYELEDKINDFFYELEEEEEN